MISFLFFLFIAIIMTIIGLFLLWLKIIDKDKSISLIIALLVTAFGAFATKEFVVEISVTFNNIDIIKKNLKPKLIKSIIVLKGNACNKKFKKTFVKDITNKNIIKKIIKVFSKSEIFIDRPTGDSFVLIFILKDNSKYTYHVSFGEKQTFISPIKLIYKSNMLEYSCGSTVLSSSSLFDVLKRINLSSSNEK